MHDLTKIATCSYCGNRTILSLAGRVQHELACSSCGARLHTLRQLKVDPDPRPRRTPVASRPVAKPMPKRKPKRKSRRMKDFWEFVEDAIDTIEDIFD